MRRPVLARRDRALRGGQPLAFGVGLVVALVVGVFLLVGSGHDPLRVYARMFDASLGDPRAWSVTLNRAVPLGLAGLAVAVAGSMGLWNIGAEGQIMAGAIGFLALAGAHMQDRKKRAMMGDAWDDWQSRTSYWPRFGKLVQAGATAWIGGLLIWLGATYGHIHANGMPAGIWRWVG